MKKKAKTGRRVISASGAFEIEERNLAQWCVRDLKMKLKPMDDIRWNRQFSWQRQPIFGTLAVDISSSSARYTFGGIPSTFDPQQRRLSFVGFAPSSYLEKETSLLQRDYRTFFLSIFSSITSPSFLLFHAFAFANRRIYIHTSSLSVFLTWLVMSNDSNDRFSRRYRSEYRGMQNESWILRSFLRHLYRIPCLLGNS